MHVIPLSKTILVNFLLNANTTNTKPPHKMMRNSSRIFKIFFIAPNVLTANCTPLATCIASKNVSHNISTPQGAKRTHPSSDRNQNPIAEAIRNQVEHSQPKQWLEIASGYGQHAGYFAPRFPNITFQPTEIDPINFASIRAYAADCVTKNIRDPLLVDICVDYAKWEPSTFLQPNSYDYMFNCNMFHISPWNCSIGLFSAAAILLKPNGLIFTYGPYKLNGVLTPESNVNFDKSLRARNPEWGVRDIVDLRRVAAEKGIELKESLNMPANNKFLVWIKKTPGSVNMGKFAQNSSKCNK